MSDRISRRTLLKGASAALALPLLDAMQPLRAATGVATSPTRFAFIYIPNGVVQDAWYPKSTGEAYDLPPALKSLATHKKHLTVITGMDRKFGGGTGVHAQAGACWLTSSSPDQPLDGGFPTNVSLDRMIANQVGRETMLPSLELSCNDHTNNKETKYFESISWYGPGHCANVEKNPRNVFRRLFGRPTGDPMYRSVLDVVLEDARALRGRLGRDDQRKVDEYLDSVRATETRIQNAEKAAARIATPPMDEPEGIPDRRDDYIRLMGELMVHAFRLDLTRVATLVIDPERWDTPRMYDGMFDKPQNHHVLTHTRGDDAKETLKKIDLFHMNMYAKLIGQMASIKEGDGTLLDHAAVTIGSGLGDGSVHDYGDLPVIIAGRAGGRLKTGQALRPKDEPLANLWLTLLQLSGGQVKRFADSTGPLKSVLA